MLLDYATALSRNFCRANLDRKRKILPAVWFGLHFVSQKNISTMKREVEREARLPAFALPFGELELLWKRMSDVFTGEEKVRKSISFSIPRESLEFDSIDELRAYSELRGQVTNFSISMARGNESIVVKSGGFFSTVPVLKVRGHTDLWCASAVEAVTGVIDRNRTWYWWLMRLPFTLFFFFASILPIAVNWLLSREVKYSLPVTVAWFSAVATLGFISLSHEKLLPQATIVISNELGFVRRYGAKIGLALGIISFIASVLMWLFPITA